ncbi:MAG: hypothetical protein PWQ35_560, partial [Patescibacteria group bacterium]|nr:hypothetical protein [Patescibacteria group bacterium]
ILTQLIFIKIIFLYIFVLYCDNLQKSGKLINSYGDNGSLKKRKL